MLELVIPTGDEIYDDEKEEFIYPNAFILRLEHSLVSISKWESKWHKPFLSKNDKTMEETLDYIQCMTLTENVPEEVYSYLTSNHITQINNYILDPMTATTFSNDKGGKGKGEIVTNELIYYWMIALGIPSEYQYWHLNHLLTLIKVCNIKNSPPKKMSKRELMSRNASLNEARRKQFNSRG